MCRLLGIVGKRAVPVSECLTTAKRSLSVLSREHPDGWGIALHSRSAEGWRVHRSTERAHACGEFRRVAEEGAAEPFFSLHSTEFVVTCAFLATPYARRLSGETFYVDGGAHIMG